MIFIQFPSFNNSVEKIIEPLNQNQKMINLNNFFIKEKDEMIIENIKIKSVSGEIKVQGVHNNLNAKSVSGDINLKYTKILSGDTLATDTVNGDVKIIIPNTVLIPDYENSMYSHNPIFSIFRPPIFV